MRLALPTALLAATASALLYTVACPPYAWAVAGWVVPGLLMVPCRRLRPWVAGLVGMWFSLLWGAGVTGWAFHASLEYFDFDRVRAAAFVVAVWLVYGLPFGVMLALYARVANDLPISARGALAGWSWAAMEVLRTTLFTGMPWELLGHTQYRHLVLVQIADLGGVYAVSFVIALTSVTLAELVRERRAVIGAPAMLLRRLGPVAAVLLAVLAYGAHADARWSAPSGTPSIAIATVQGNVENAFRWKRMHFERTLRTYAVLTESTRAATPDLVVWPENAVDFYLDREPMLRSQLSAAARLAPGGLLVGSPRLASSSEARNSAQLLGADGAIRGVYDKQHLVPFAEYDPLRTPAADAADPTYGPGGPAAPVDTGVGRVGAMICYEVLFPRLVNDLVRRGAQVLINVANDSWLDAGDGAAPAQHFSMAVFRAIETRRDLLRAAGSGASGFVDPYGRIGAVIPHAVAGAVVARVHLRDTLTPYVRWGDTWIFVFGLALAVDLRRHLRRSVAP